jgi:hypothetical protein
MDVTLRRALPLSDARVLRTTFSSSPREPALADPVRREAVKFADELKQTA